MSIVKVIEVIAESDKSWEDATQNALDHAGKSITGIQNIYLSDFKAIVENNKITKYRAIAKISFLVND